MSFHTPTLPPKPVRHDGEETCAYALRVLEWLQAQPVHRDKNTLCEVRIGGRTVRLLRYRDELSLGEQLEELARSRAS